MTTRAASTGSWSSRGSHTIFSTRFLKRSLVSRIRLALAVLTQAASTEGLTKQITHVPRSGNLLEARGWSIGEGRATCWCCATSSPPITEHDERRGWRVRSERALKRQLFGCHVDEWPLGEAVKMSWSCHKVLALCVAGLLRTGFQGPRPQVPPRGRALRSPDALRSVQPGRRPQRIDARSGLVNTSHKFPLDPQNQQTNVDAGRNAQL